MAQAAPAQSVPAGNAAGGGAGLPPPDIAQPESQSAQSRRSPAHYLWAARIARIYEVFPLICPLCAGQMRIIAFITDGAEVRKILERIGVDFLAPRVSPARGPPLWDGCDAPAGECVQALLEWDLPAQPALDYPVDQRVSW